MGRFDACTCLQDSGHEALDVKDQYRAQVEEDLAALAYLHEPLGFEWCCSTGFGGRWLLQRPCSEALGPAGAARAPGRGGLRRAWLRPAGMGEAAAQPPGAFSPSPPMHTSVFASVRSRASPASPLRARARRRFGSCDELAAWLSTFGKSRLAHPHKSVVCREREETGATRRLQGRGSMAEWV